MKKSIVVAGIAALTLFDIAAAGAADLPGRSPPPIFTTPAPTWTGFYVGVQGGYRFDEVNGTGFLADPGGITDTVSSKFNLDTAVVGPRVGYDYQILPTFVIGVAGDFSYGDRRVSLTQSALIAPPPVLQAALVGNDGVIITPGSTITGNVQVRHQWDATVRGRVGYLFTPEVLLYATGGLALLDEHLNASYTVDGVFGGVYSASKTRVGYTVGGGIEGAITDHWRAHVEYRYADYGSETYRWADVAATAKIKSTTNTILAGVSYKF